MRAGETLDALPIHLPASGVVFVIKRVYHQRTGYWKPDGEGVEHFAPGEWAAALNLLGQGKAQAFVRSARTLNFHSLDGRGLR